MIRAKEKISLDYKFHVDFNMFMFPLKLYMKGRKSIHKKREGRLENKRFIAL